ncbi:MAG: hypothetical protein KAV87_27115 [Desulfobacteraceae bacterium]|nr:hypothetical protein [Desulfobacteraceae bacterium]
MGKKLNEQEIAICKATGVTPEDYMRAESTTMEYDALPLERKKMLVEKIAKTMKITPEEASKRMDQFAKETEAGQSLTIEEIEICRRLGVLPLEYLLQRQEDAERN